MNEWMNEWIDGWKKLMKVQPFLGFWFTNTKTMHVYRIWLKCPWKKSDLTPSLEIYSQWWQKKTEFKHCETIWEQSIPERRGGIVIRLLNQPQRECSTVPVYSSAARIRTLPSGTSRCVPTGECCIVYRWPYFPDCIEASGRREEANKGGS